MALKAFNGGQHAAALLPNGFGSSTVKPLQGKYFNPKVLLGFSLMLRIKVK